MSQVFELIRTMVQARFWGEVTIKFQDGKPVVVTKEEQIKIV